MKKLVILVFLAVILALAPAWAGPPTGELTQAPSAGAPSPDNLSPTSTPSPTPTAAPAAPLTTKTVANEPKKTAPAATTVPVVNNYYPVQTIVQELPPEKIKEILKKASRGKAVPVIYAPLIEQARKDGILVGKTDEHGNFVPVSLNEGYVESWRVAIALGRMAKKQAIRDNGRDEKIVHAQSTATTALGTAQQAQGTATNALQRANVANTAANKANAQVGRLNWWGGRATLVICLLMAGLALVLVFLALRWYLAAWIVGVPIWVGLFILTLIWQAWLLFGIVILVGIVSLAWIMWAVYPQFADAPVHIPPPAVGAIGLGRPRVN